MQIVELGDNTMVIMKDSSDTIGFSIGNIYRRAVKHNGSIYVNQKEAPFDQMRSDNYVYTAGRLVLFFQVPVRPTFYLHETVSLDVI